MLRTLRRAVWRLGLLLIALAPACTALPPDGSVAPAGTPTAVPADVTVTAVAEIRTTADPLVAPTPSGLVEPVTTPSATPAPAGGGQSPAPAAVAATPVPPAPPHDPPGIAGVTAAAYVLMEAANGAVLAEHYAQERRSPASLTKIMTALVALERVGLDEVVTVPEAVTSLRASTLMGIPPGERLTVRDLLYGLMLPSGNDAGIALAVHVSGSEPAFAAQMNQRARELGMRDTQFLNSHGLDFRDWGSPYTTAFDLALATRAAMQIDTFRTVVAARSFTGAGADRAYPLRNINSFLGSYAGATGVKTGWTRRAGATIAATATRNGRTLIAIVLGAADRDGDARRLLNHGFASSSG